MKLSAKADFGFDGEPMLALVGDDFRGRNISRRDTHSVAIHIDEQQHDQRGHWVRLPEDLKFIQPGDILRLNPSSKTVRVLYRRASAHNVLFVTNRCNSRCVMCSQPPTEADDGYLVDEILQVLPWMSESTKALGITGGEPTLLGDRLIEVIASAKQHLPSTELHMLSNGRLFTAQLARRIGDLQHHGFMVGVPLYADTAADHDFVVQARGAFDETIEGLLNLADAGIRTEIRVVIHRYTADRLASIATFIERNLPFVEQVAFMGLEPIGFARSNLSALWIHPRDFALTLGDAMTSLVPTGIKPLIYNVPLCALPPTLRQFSRRSISDWKNEFAEECDACRARSSCCGFFSWSTHLPAPLRLTPVPVV